MKNYDTKNLLTHIKEQKFSIDSCFLCGTTLTSQNNSREHVIPKWLQNRYDLWAQKLTLCNKSSISYRQLTIPCCHHCNNNILQPIEKKISSALAEGGNAIQKIDKNELFIWLGKIFYGLYYKEMTIPLDRRTPQSGPIMPTTILEHFSMHRFFLHKASEKVTFENFFPASIVFVNCQEQNDPKLNWDIIDGLYGFFIAIRMNHVGIIAVLQDCEHRKKYWEPEIRQLSPYSLNPLQFSELACRYMYQVRLHQYFPHFYTNINSNNGVHNIFHTTTDYLPHTEHSEQEVFEDFFHFFSQKINIPFDQLCWPEKKQCTSFLYDSSGQFKLTKD